MSATTIIYQAFGENAHLYKTVLGMSLPPSSSWKDITTSQLRKAYYRRALQYHPDKQQQRQQQHRQQQHRHSNDNDKSNEEQEEATKLKFQAVSLAYSILSKAESRREYDEHGEIYDNDYYNDTDRTNNNNNNNNNNNSNHDMWKEFFSSTFKNVTSQDIDTFATSYKYSDEEEKDVLKYYVQFKGNLNKMMNCVMCSDGELGIKERWVLDYIKPAIERGGGVEDYMGMIEKTLGDNSNGNGNGNGNGACCAYHIRYY